MTVTAEKLGDGLNRLTTGAGSYDSLIVEFRDHVMMLEAGQPEARSVRYIAETKKQFPGKPIRYMMEHAPALRSHGWAAGGRGRRRDHHHAGEQQGVLREGAQHAANAAQRHAREESEASQDRYVGEKKVYSDGARTVEIYHMYPTPHSNGLTVAFIPKEKILFQADFTLPAAGQPANDHIKALNRSSRS